MLRVYMLYTNKSVKYHAHGNFHGVLIFIFVGDIKITKIYPLTFMCLMQTVNG